MNIIWDYPDFQLEVSLPMGAMLKGLYRGNHRPNKVVIHIQEYRDAIDEMGLTKVDRYMVSTVKSVIAPVKSEIIIEVFKRP